MVAAALLMLMSVLPAGSAPQALSFDHFPDRLHAFVWRNWSVTPLDRMATTVGATTGELEAIGRSMGLGAPPTITENQWMRSYITVIRRNWHLLPYEQLLTLLGWSEEEMAFALREDDFLFIKLGSLKPKCEPLTYTSPDVAAQARAAAIAATVRAHFPDGPDTLARPLFDFVRELSDPANLPAPSNAHGTITPRYCYSYFALYGDPLLTPEIDPYPDAYLARLAASGVDGVWLQGVLFKLAPFPWNAALSAQHESRIESLRGLVARAKKHGIGVYLYLNEPRTMPVEFFAEHPDLRGASDGAFASMCTSAPEVHRYIADSVSHICREVPELAGFFTITASENPTNCWSHGRGGECTRCGPKGPAAVIAGVNAIIQEGIDTAGTDAKLIAWDWGWADDWALDAIAALPVKTGFMSVSEWSIPIERGGIKSVTGEYALSATGPGPRATRHWAAAEARGLKRLAKLQVGTTWELGAVPYIPVVARVADHLARLRDAGIQGMQLGWTLGGYPSPNLEVAAILGQGEAITPQAAMARVAERRYGAAQAPAVVRAWQAMSDVFAEFPYHVGTVYNAPLQVGPANLLYPTPTGYAATMVGIPYDDMAAWRNLYPPAIFAQQLVKVADGFEAAIATLMKEVDAPDAALQKEMDVAVACAIHFRSVANQTVFVETRDALAAATDAVAKEALTARLRAVVDAERALALQLWAIQRRDPRIGYEATNHYFYVPMDLAEKVVECAWLLDGWLGESAPRSNDGHEAERN
jgi:hypothetical protein